MTTRNAFTSLPRMRTIATLPSCPPFPRRMKVSSVMGDAVVDLETQEVECDDEGMKERVTNMFKRANAAVSSLSSGVL